MSFLTPLALALAALAIPIILLYMLRLRRRDVPVSSTLLWERLMRDREANAPWQRLRRNLLLFLQLLILAALVLALARPYREVPAVGAGNVTVLLDASASMNATDVGDAASRFERARQLVADMVRQLGEGNAMTLIEVGPTPRVLVAGATDEGVLLGALGNAAPSLGEADWSAALALSAVGAQGSEAFSVVVVSDGGLPEGLPPVPGELRYVPVGARDSNLAITALSARAVAGQGPELFAQITNFGAQDMDVIFSLELDDELYDAATYLVPANDAVDASFSDLPDATLIRASLTRPAASTQADYLAADDTAWAVYQPPGTGRVLLVSPGNVYIEQLLLALPGAQPFRLGESQPLPAEPYDLYIFDTVLPEALPPATC
ncbi:MAG: VWA domain-containing protein [Anaerolineae bacterium]|nr:VWA domain-containing protein [Anaerolineae bacterium]